MVNTPSQKKSSFWKIFTTILLVLLAASVIFIGLLPSIVSSTWGKSYLTKTINESIPGRISIDRISLSWLGHQKIVGLKLYDPEDEQVLNFDSATVETSLIKILFNLKNLNVVRLNAFNANLVTDGAGHTNLMRTIDKSDDWQFKDNHLNVRAAIKNMNGTLELGSSNSPFKFQVDGQTEQGTLKGRFNVDAKLSNLDFLNELNTNSGIIDFLKNNKDANLAMNAEVINFPVELIDQIVALKNPENAGIVLKTIGHYLNVNIIQQTIDNSIGLRIAAESPNLTTQAEIIIASEIKLSKPAIIKLKINPDLSELLSSLKESLANWKLSDSTTADIVIENLELPLQILTTPLKEIDLQTIAIRATGDISHANFVNSTNQSNIILNGLHAVIDAKINQVFAKISLTGDAANNEQPMKLKINSTLPKDLIFQTVKDVDLKRIFIEGQIQGAPLFVLNQHEENVATLAELLGPIADITFSLRESGGKSLCSIKYASERFDLNSLDLEITDKITLIQPTIAVMKIPPAVINQTLKASPTRIQNPMIANFEIKTFNAPLSVISSNWLNYFYKIDLDANLNVPAVKLIGIPSIGPANLANLNMHIVAAQSSRPDVTMFANIVSEGPGKLYDLIGKDATINANGSIGIGLDGKPTLTVFNINFLSDLCRAEVSGRMVEGQRLVLQNPVLISYVLTPAGLNSLGFSAENFKFSKASPVQLTIESSHIPLNLSNLSALKLAGKIKINNLQVQSKAHGEFSLATLDNLNADWNIDGTSNRLDISFAGVTLMGEQLAAGKLNGSVSIDGWHQNGNLSFEKSDARIKAVASNLPTQLLSSFSNNYDLLPIFGNALNVDLLANIPSNRQTKGTVDIEISSKNLQGAIALVLNDTIRLSDHRQTEFRLDLTPEGYDALRQIIKGSAIFDFYLTETAKATIKVKTLNFPGNGKFLQSGINASYAIEQLSGQDMKTKNVLAIRSLQGQIAAENLSKHVDFDVSAKAKTNESADASWTILGKLDNAFTADGSLNNDSLSLQLDATIETLPISLLCQFACVDLGLRNKLEAVIGPTLSAKVKANLRQMNGPLYVDLLGKNGHLNIDAELNNGYLILKKQATAQVTVTPQLGKYVLSEFIPIISGMLSADHPIKLTLDPKGFQLPLKDPFLINTSIGKATLEMGKVYFSNSSQLAKVLSLLTTASADKFMVWLTPVYFSLDQGVLDLKRVDMLISDRYPIAAFGNVDFIRERVAMIIGLSGSAIQRSFSVSGIPNSYLLQIPLRGKLDSPTFDKTKAAARLSAIVAQTQGGPQGLVLGTVLDIASGGLTEAKPPAPTTNPLPWADLMTEQNESDIQKIEKQLMTPLDEVKKGASSILKKIFK